jgi:hypothetical protein
VCKAKEKFWMNQNDDKTFTATIHKLVGQFHSVATPENIRGSFVKAEFSYSTGAIPDRSFNPTLHTCFHLKSFNLLLVLLLLPFQHERSIFNVAVSSGLKNVQDGQNPFKSSGLRPA